jgi:hypothetical protein
MMYLLSAGKDADVRLKLADKSLVLKHVETGANMGTDSDILQRKLGFIISDKEAIEGREACFRNSRTQVSVRRSQLQHILYLKETQKKTGGTAAFKFSDMP